MGCAREKLWYVIADNVVLVVQDGIYGLVGRLFVFTWILYWVRELLVVLCAIRPLQARFGLMCKGLYEWVCMLRLQVPNTVEVYMILVVCQRPRQLLALQ